MGRGRSYSYYEMDVISEIEGCLNLDVQGRVH